MRKIGYLGLIAASAALGACTMNEEHAAAMHAQADATAHANLRQALAGYSQGETTSCVNSRDLEGNRSFGPNAILFEGTGDRFFLNRPSNCPALGPGRSLRVRSVGTQLCRGDIADVVDISSGVELGGCALGDFTRYVRGR